jgi:selenocysteine lyase/cysteine desulfurase
VFGSEQTEDQAGIVALEKAGASPDEFARQARCRGIVVSSRRGRLRISPHVYNNDDDLDRLDELLRLAP